MGGVDFLPPRVLILPCCVKWQMISHDTLYGLANVLGSLAILLTVAYHFVAVNAKTLSKGGGNAGVLSAATTLAD